MVDRGPLTWAPVGLSTDRVVFDTSCLGTETEHHAVWTVIHTDSVTRIEREGNLAGLVSQGRFRCWKPSALVGGSRLSTYVSQFLSGLLTWKRSKLQEDFARISFGISLE
jgi:hypothetical protein